MFDVWWMVVMIVMTFSPSTSRAKAENAAGRKLGWQENVKLKPPWLCLKQWLLSCCCCLSHLPTRESVKRFARAVAILQPCQCGDKMGYMQFISAAPEPAESRCSCLQLGPPTPHHLQLKANCLCSTLARRRRHCTLTCTPCPAASVEHDIYCGGCLGYRHQQSPGQAA